jgi:hypothetical protein
MAVYRRRPGDLSTGNRLTFWAASSRYPSIKRLFRTRQNKALIHAAPHSGHIHGSSLRSSSRDGSANGGSQPPSFRPINEGLDPSLTGHGPSGILPALIWGPADGNWGQFGCGKPPSIAGAGDGELGPDTVARRISIEACRRYRARQ